MNSRISMQLEYVCAIIRTLTDAQTFASSLQLELGARHRLFQSQCDLYQISVESIVIYLLIPDEKSDLLVELDPSNHYYAVGLRIENELIEISNQFQILKQSEIISFHKSVSSSIVFHHEWLQKLDHILFVTPSLNRVEKVLKDNVGILPSFTHSQWYFPDFGVTDMTYKAKNGYIEVNEPHGKDGIFANYIAHNGEGLFALAFKAIDIENAMTKMKLNGVRYGEMMAIRAVPPHTNQEEVIQHSVTLSLKSTAGLRVLVVNESWF